MEKPVVIMKVLAEGGSITLTGFRSGADWLFTMAVNEAVLLDLLDEPTASRRPETARSWVDALSLIDRYPWPRLYPKEVHLDFRKRVLEVVTARLGLTGDSGSEALDRWRQVCGDDALKYCISEPIPEIFESARLLHSAVTAHVEGNRQLADKLICEANIQVIGDWLDPIWLHREDAVKVKKVDGLPLVIPKENRHKPRNVLAIMRRALVERDGHHCRFCGMPVVRREVRDALNRLYPEAAQWKPGSGNYKEQHRGLQAMWLQYDHVVVHSRGGETTLENLVVACAACNFGRDRYTLEEVGVRDPRTPVRLPTWDGRQTWTGLELFLPESQRYVQSTTSPFKPA